MHFCISFSLVALSGEEPHPNDKVGKNEMLFSDVGSLRRSRHEERSDEVVPESALVDTNGISIRRKAPRRRRREKYSSIVSFQANRASFVANFYPLCRSGQKMEKVGEGRGRAGSSYAFERFMILSYSVENGRQNASNFSP